VPFVLFSATHRQPAQAARPRRMRYRPRPRTRYGGHDARGYLRGREIDAAPRRPGWGLDKLAGKESHYTVIPSEAPTGFEVPRRQRCRVGGPLPGFEFVEVPSQPVDHAGSDYRPDRADRWGRRTGQAGPASCAWTDRVLRTSALAARSARVQTRTTKSRTRRGA
jgi:hypothetical protein